MNRDKLIGLCGRMGAGKTAFAKRLEFKHGYIRLRFADTLKNMMAAFGLSHSEIDGDNKNKPSPLLGGKTPRYAMQTLGTEWGRNCIGPDVWVNALKASLLKLPAHVPLVIDDVRFPNEVDMVRSLGGIVIRIVRPADNDNPIPEHTHASEQSDRLSTDFTIHNTATLSALYDKADLMAFDVANMKSLKNARAL